LLFSAILANVVVEEAGEGRSYRLETVAVGLGTHVEGRDRIITSATQAELGADLDFPERLILGQGEKRLDNTMRVACSKTTKIVDTPAFFADGQQHRRGVLRYALLLHPQTGQLVTLAWRINLDDAGAHADASGPVVMIEPNLIETCRVHVDGREVFAGIPNSKAFAALGLPPGRKMALPQIIRAVASRKRFSTESFGRLEDSLRRMANALWQERSGKAH
jgi:hypothetical protein